MQIEYSPVTLYLVAQFDAVSEKVRSSSSRQHRRLQNGDADPHAKFTAVISTPSTFGPSSSSSVLTSLHRLVKNVSSSVNVAKVRKKASSSIRLSGKVGRTKHFNFSRSHSHTVIDPILDRRLQKKRSAKCC